MRRSVGDMYRAPCPECGESITDLWDRRIREGDRLECTECGVVVTVEELETVVHLVSGATEQGE